jgi:hypothetical protein
MRWLCSCRFRSVLPLSQWSFRIGTRGSHSTTLPGGRPSISGPASIRPSMMPVLAISRATISVSRFSLRQQSPRWPGRGDIYVSELQPNGSFGPATIVEELSTPANDQRPNIRFDGLELFFNRDVDPLFINDNDIWVSTRNAVSDPWGAPVKLGSTVNSELDDVRPYFAADRETLFFESGPNEPVGDLDIYAATRSRNGECD